jgi:hypothetical protein
MKAWLMIAIFASGAMQKPGWPGWHGICGLNYSNFSVSLVINQRLSNG